MKSKSLFETLMPALVGVAGTLLGVSITLFYTDQIESTKIREARVGAAIGHFVEAAWAERSDANALKLTRALTGLAIYAPSDVVNEISMYTRTNCLDIDDRNERCKELWISVLENLRELAGSEEVPPESLRHITWKGSVKLEPNKTLQATPKGGAPEY